VVAREAEAPGIRVESANARAGRGLEGDRYYEQRGHPRLRMRHAPFAIGQEARDRWLQLMERALNEASLPAESDAMLREFFASTATFLMNRQTP